MKPYRTVKHSDRFYRKKLKNLEHKKIILTSDYKYRMKQIELEEEKIKALL